MKQFIKAKNEEGKTMFVNLNLVLTVATSDSGYVLNVLGNKFLVESDCEEIKAIISQS